MNKMSARRWPFGAVVIGVAVVLVVGLGAGAAAGLVPTLLSPAGLSDGEGMATKSMLEPDYPRNADGLTYGSAADASAPGNEPDLILVIADDGKQGYVLKSDLDIANGTAAQATFKTPEDALAWQAGEGSKDHTIQVFASDGKTATGSFTIVAGKGAAVTDR